jgi:hypothetical protein
MADDVHARNAEQERHQHCFGFALGCERRGLIEVSSAMSRSASSRR